MKYLYLTLLLALTGWSTTLSAQSRVVLSVPDVIATGLEELICVPVVADSFPSIVSTQFSLAWDSTEVRFEEVRLGNDPLGLGGTATSSPRNDQFRVSFIPSNAMGISLDPGTVMFELCFSPKNDVGFTRIGFDGESVPEFVLDGTFVPFPFDTIPGSITYGTTAAATVLPGDTDGNQQVDHRDLLNIGLLNGQTGPARPGASTDFVPQAAAWASNLNSGVNYANVDADGNGTIDGADAEVVASNYAMENNGNFEFAPSIATPAGPALRLAFPDMVDAGQETTLTVELGDGANPDAVGYGMAITLAFDAAQVDMESFSVDFDGSFLGDDLLSIWRVNPRGDGIVEIALSRTDQINTTAPGGQVVSVSFTTLPAADDGNYDLAVSVVPNAFIRADQTTGPINGSEASVLVMGSSAVATPAWAGTAIVYPNPTADRLYIRDLTTTAALDYTIFSSGGERVRSDRFNGRDIDLGDLPTGTYRVVLTDGLQHWLNTVMVGR